MSPAQQYLHGRIDSCVCSQAEVSSRDIVADGGRDYTHGDTELFIVSPSFKELQHAFIPLWESHQDGNNVNVTIIGQLI